MKTQRIVIGILLIVLIILLLSLYFYGNKISKLTTENNMLQSVNDEMTTTINKYGQFVNTKSVIIGDPKDLLNINKNDSLFKEMQKLVDENKRLMKKFGRVSIINNETVINNSTPTTITHQDSSAIYASSFKDQWIQYAIVAKKDTTSLYLNFKDTISIVVKEEKRTINNKRKKVPVAEVTSYNPYSNVKNFYVYNVGTPKPKRFSLTIGAQVGAGAGYTDKFVGVPYIGIGATVGWSPIRF